MAVVGILPNTAFWGAVGTIFCTGLLAPMVVGSFQAVQQVIVPPEIQGRVFALARSGMDVMSPFEVASGCDVIEIGRQYPDLVMFGGVDKRVLAQGRDAIDELVDRIFPAMRKRGGYIPTSDHGVPEEVPYDDYLYYRERCLEFAE